MGMESLKENTTKAGRIRFSISKKLLLSFVLLTVLICAVSTISGYYQYENTIRKLYNDNGYVIANIILDHVDHDRIAMYAQTWEEDEYYPEMAAYLKSVEEASGAAYIYIVTISPDQTMRYIYDSSGLSIGDTDPLSSYFDEAWAAYTQGVKPASYMVRHSARYGYLTSSMLPVRDSEGNIAAVLLVDVWMEMIMVLGGASSYTEFKGALAENMILQSYIATNYDVPYYWTSSGRAEIEFVVQNGVNIVPIEVKAAGCVGGKSLTVYNEKFNPAVRIRFSANNLQKNDNMISCPLYLSDWLFTKRNWVELL